MPELLSAARPQMVFQRFTRTRHCRDVGSIVQFNWKWFSPSANLCFWDGIMAQRCRQFSYLWWHSVCSVCFWFVMLFGNSSWHAHEDIPSHSLITAHERRWRGVCVSSRLLRITIIIYNHETSWRSMKCPGNTRVAFPDPRCLFESKRCKIRECRILIAG